MTGFFLGSEITVDGDCSHDIRRRLLLGRKAVPNADSVLKSRDITLPTKIHIVKCQGTFDFKESNILPFLKDSLFLISSYSGND